jgi:hypothetical protein
MICFSLEKLVSRAHGGAGQGLTGALTAGCYGLRMLAAARETWREQQREAHLRL